MALLEEKRIHKAFQISVFLKGGHAALVQEELIEDPHDIIANYLFTFAQQFSVKTKAFAAFYLLSHGVIKLIQLHRL